MIFRRRVMVWLSGLAAAIATIVVASAPAGAASDPRWFGTYCGSHSETMTIRVRFLGFTVSTTERTLRFNVRMQAEYSERLSGRGLVTGAGVVTGEGRSIPFVISGGVVARGRLQGGATAAGLDSVNGTAELSADGETAVIRGMDRRLSLAKSACGNSAPTAAILQPAPGASPAWGTAVRFVGRAADTEDGSFPAERLVWASNLDGHIGNGPEVTFSRLSPGSHTITFAATDSGGRTATSSVAITIGNNPPNIPRLVQPRTGDVAVEGALVTLRGSATDREQGELPDGALSWSSDRDGVLGTGALLQRRLSVGTHRIFLTATDRQGATSRNSVTMTVASRPVGNVAPRVTIVLPRDWTGAADTNCLTFVAEASDLEDGRLAGTALTWTDRYNDGTTDRTRTLGTGERIDVCNFPNSGRTDTRTISVTATDRGGLTGIDTITVFIIPGGLI
jgi:hypothetical protein